MAWHRVRSGSQTGLIFILGLVGSVSLIEFENTKAFAPLHSPPKKFDELLLDGIALRASKDLSIADIESYRQRLLVAEMTQTLPWMTPWLRSTHCYREQRYSEAYPHAMEAYEGAQYCAGARQCLLLNQYIDLAAKSNKWKEFRKAALWAEYLGIEVRGMAS
jgi:hypothetical protein